MSRPIKFRAWHSKQKKMYSAEEMSEDQMCLLPTGYFINVSGTSTKLSRIDFDRIMIPLQFTGLLDKNGKEIWEGDIVKDYWRYKLYAVSFFSGAFRGHYDDLEPQSENSTGWLFDKVEADNCKVVGNIYENPELLETTK